MAATGMMYLFRAFSYGIWMGELWMSFGDSVSPATVCPQAQLASQTET